MITLITKMIFLADFLVGTEIQALTSTSTIKSQQSTIENCTTYTYNRCYFDEDVLLDTLFDITDSDCQYFCDEIYREKSKYFVYDYCKGRCHIYGSQKEDDFGSYCSEHGGPPQPSIATCAGIEDPCKVLSKYYL